MKKQLFFLTALFLFFLGCNDPIFYTIHEETEILEPLIKGSPTNFANYNGYMYVASGSTLFYYKDGFWGFLPFGNRILQLASTNNELYILMEGRPGHHLLRYTGNIDIISVPGYFIRSIFTAGNELFIGAEAYFSQEYLSILHRNDSGFKDLLPTDISSPEAIILRELFLNKALRGAAFDGEDYYFCTTDIISDLDGGIYKISDLTDEKAAVILKETPYVAIISIEDNVFAMTRLGRLHNMSGVEVARLGSMSSGALAIHKTTITVNIDGDDVQQQEILLLAGKQDGLRYNTSSGYTYGYEEVEFNLSAKIFMPSPFGLSFREPGLTTPSTLIHTHGRYLSTIGKHPISHIFQAENGILFASTQKDGVWSLKQRPDGIYWNAEQ